MNRKLLATALTISGGFLLIAGVALIHFPTAMILAGILLVVAGLFAINVDGS